MQLNSNDSINFVEVECTNITVMTKILRTDARSVHNDSQSHSTGNWAEWNQMAWYGLKRSFLQKNIGVCHIWCMQLSKNQSSLPSCNAVFHWSILDNDGYRHPAVLVAVGLEWVASCVNCHPVFSGLSGSFRFLWADTPDGRPRFVSSSVPVQSVIAMRVLNSWSAVSFDFEPFSCFRYNSQACPEDEKTAGDTISWILFLSYRDQSMNRSGLHHPYGCCRLWWHLDTVLFLCT